MLASGDNVAVVDFLIETKHLAEKQQCDEEQMSPLDRSAMELSRRFASMGV